MTVQDGWRFLKKPWVFLALVLLVCSGPWLWPVEEVVVRADLPYVHTHSVEQALAGSIRWGMWWSSLTSSAKALHRFPWVAQSHIKRVYPNRWEVVLQPPPIVARWHEGGVINARGERVVLHPMPQGFDQKPLWVARSVDLPKMIALMRSLDPALKQFPFRLKQLRFSALSGWVLLFSEHVTVRLSLRSDASHSFAQFLTKLDQVGGVRALRGKVIDLRYGHGFSISKS